MIEYKGTIKVYGYRCFDLKVKAGIEVGIELVKGLITRRPLDENYDFYRNFYRILTDPSNWRGKYVPLHKDIINDTLYQIEEAGDGNLVIIPENLAKGYISGRYGQRNNVVEIPEREPTKYSSFPEMVLEACQSNMLGSAVGGYMLIPMAKSLWELEEALSDLVVDIRVERRALKEGDRLRLGEVQEEVKEFSEFLGEDEIDEVTEKIFPQMEQLRRDIQRKYASTAKQVREDWNRRVLKMVGDEVEDNIELVRVVPYSNRIVDALAGCYRNRKLKI